MASSRGSTASSKPPKQRLAVTAQSATSKPWFTCSQPNSISCFQTEIVATHAKQRRTIFYTELHGVHTEFHGVEDSWARSALKTYSVKLASRFCAKKAVGRRGW